MAKLDYQLPSSVLEAVGKTVAGEIDPNLVAASKGGAGAMSAAQVIMKGEEARRVRLKEKERQAERDRVEQARADAETEARSKHMAKFDINARSLLDGNVKGGKENQKAFQVEFVDEMKNEYLEAVEKGDHVLMGDIMQELKELGDTTTSLSDSTKSLVTNGDKKNEAGFDRSDGVIPTETLEWMGWVIDLETSGANMEILEDGSMGYQMPLYENDGETPLMDDDGNPAYKEISKSMIADVNTNYLNASEEKGIIAAELKAVEQNSIKTLAAKDDTSANVGFDRATHFNAIMDTVTEDRIRSTIFSNDMWGKHNEDGTRQSFFDNWSAQEIKVNITNLEGAPKKLMRFDAPTEDAEGNFVEADGVLSPEEIDAYILGGGDKKAIAELLCLPENFETARAVIGDYVNELITQNTHKDVVADESWDPNNLPD